MINCLELKQPEYGEIRASRFIAPWVIQIEFELGGYLGSNFLAHSFLMKINGARIVPLRIRLQDGILDLCRSVGNEGSDRYR